MSVTTSPESAALASGARVGAYRVSRRLGEGACGTVYVAERVAEGSTKDGGSDLSAPRVALKVIHRHLLKDRQVRSRFFREAGILRALRAEGVVALLDFGEAEDGLLFMALELVEGQSLAELCARQPLEPARAVGLMLQVCNALEFAHAAGVIHRDLKPSNVIVERSADGSEQAKILDFGMAKVLRAPGSDSLTALTEQNMIFGTPEYMAPEQARGDEVDSRCDVYAAGVILYELLTGSVPFVAPTPIGVMTAHLVEEPKPPSSRLPPGRIAPALEVVVLYALSKDRAERYPTASALAEALRRAERLPFDVVSMAPPSSDDPNELAERDTEYDLALRPTDAFAPAGTTSRRFWIALAVVAALASVAAGVLLSLIKP